VPIGVSIVSAFIERLGPARHGLLEIFCKNFGTRMEASTCRDPDPGRESRGDGTPLPTI